MRVSLFFVGIFLFVGVAFADLQPTLTKKITPEIKMDSGWSLKERWSLSLIKSDEHEVLSESARADISGALEFTRSFEDKLFLVVRPGFRFVSGRDQDVFAERLPKDKIFADEAKISWRPDVGVDLEGGAINQAHLQNSLLVDKRPFPAARAALSTDKLWRGRGELAAQIAIPTSYTLEAQATDNEPTPSFKTLAVNFKKEILSDTNVGGGLTYYTFEELPQIVAVNSKRLGNSVELYSSSTGRFLYGFNGFAINAGVSSILGSWKLAWQGMAIKNYSAPSGLGTGYVSGLEFARNISKSHEAGTTITYYKIQPDTSPGVYSDPVFSNNRIGLGLGAFVNHLKWGLQFKVSYFKDTPYYRNDLMGDRDLFLVSVGNIIDDFTSKN